MELNLKRPLLFFDIESTGLNIPTDSIVELSFVKILPGGEQRIRTWRVCPWDYEKGCQRPVTPGAKAVNGISDEELDGEKKFYEIVPEVVSWLRDSDLSGFNSAKFDLPMLAEEIERVRFYNKKLNLRVDEKDLEIDLHAARMVDVQNIYHKLEPRNLKAAYRFYVGGDFENAHAAQADTLATYQVLKGQLDRYPEQIKNDVEWLAGFSEVQKGVDFAGRLVYNADKEPVISFGKHRGKTAREVYLSEPSYFAWIENGEFTLDTKRQFALLRQKFDEERKTPLSQEAFELSAAMLERKFNTRRGSSGGSGSLF